ncbi:YbbR-like domain-containing protein [Halalkalibacterium halodurans]|uniref:YbbR domain-containing protein n=1 Tax=Halalkalibacterium halodurans TaxID=86665 RepID=A0A0M0KEL9_ALKHA|nr:YbbR-like domain-containing protein [Halalkalibacterium halodurans]MED3647095.1 YbbR-like domain-containing protein [Halalkalibacterium halodurans]MED4162782.1 YbbR-like domain-containing protein [Halalkalibacterium halodurans]TES48823.1 YbbR-like domain-containing protein [Halalkalibacterium halodurans]TPE68881.1 YbbR-like domain-containing protein [Halalkalibacterium halodurans]
MDKLFNSPWFVKIISFFLAIMLFIMVNVDNLNNQPSILPTFDHGNLSLGELELTVLYDEERYDIVEQTETVQVDLEGPRGVLTVFRFARPSYEVFVDLTEAGEGSHTVDVEHRGFPGDLAVTVEPRMARVQLEERQTVSVPVTVEMINEEEIEPGFSPGTPVVSPVNIEVTAGRSKVEQVASAVVYVDMTGAEGEIEQDLEVQLLNAAGEPLDFDREPQTVNVRIPVESPSVELPVRVTRAGELPDGLSIESVEIEPNTVTVYGPQDVLDELSVIEGEDLSVDLSAIEDTETITLDVPVPEGAESVSPAQIEVTLHIEEEDELEMAEVPIDIVGIADNMEVVFTDGSPSVVALSVFGASKHLQNLEVGDIDIYVDVNGLSEGVHEVPLEFEGPSFLRFKADTSTTELRLTAQSNDERR